MKIILLDLKVEIETEIKFEEEEAEEGIITETEISTQMINQEVLVAEVVKFQEDFEEETEALEAEDEENIN